MSSFILKIIACITMFIDHIGYAIFNGNASFFNYIGRFAFPIFAFQISEGYSHTRNIYKYLLRMFIFALISQVPFMLFHSIINDEFALNVLFTFFLSIVVIFVYDKFNKVAGIAVALLFGIISKILNCDYGFYGVCITFLFYVCRKNKILLATSFIIATVIKYLISILHFYSYGSSILVEAFKYYLPYAICTILPISVILLYNKKKGPVCKYLFYLFYPLHMLLVYAISFMN